MLNCYCQLSSSVIFRQYGVSQSECKIDRPRPGLPRVSPRPHTEALGTRLLSAMLNANSDRRFPSKFPFLTKRRSKSKRLGTRVADICIQLFSSVGATNVTLQDIDVAHRLPPSRRQSDRPNPIIYKFTRRLAKATVMHRNIRSRMRAWSRALCPN
jgi:hypothetical protein